MARLTAEEIVERVKAQGLTVTAAWVTTRVPGGVRSSPRTPHTWAERDVTRWMKRHGLDRPRKLVRIDDLARHLGVSYWAARRQHEPVLVFGHTDKWYQLDT